ncbi:hypothetical protein M0R72_00815 [Candidatus Pacearchaeota archaeon]|nr:hypothetical protein [Candidatus Pacearchaeota archaeon]
MSKEHLLHILRDSKPDKADRLKNALEDYNGSFAVKFYLEAMLELLNPPVQCQGCDGGCCTEEHGELRKLPVGGGNLILCRPCFDHEMRYRHDEVMRGIQFELPSWESLEIYSSQES